jgi:predicted tellurium resistance membrane protein TerC
MLELLTDPNAWLSLATLTVLEIVLGIDNVIFLAIVSEQLPANRQVLARRLGLTVALLLRIILLTSITFIMSLQQPVVSAFGFGFSWRDIVLGAGGLFLLYKGTQEIHSEVETHHERHGKARVSFAGVIAQIAVLDLVFSIDSVITAVGVAEHIEIMVAAVVIAIFVMMLAAEPVAGFIHRHPTVKMLGLSFLLLIGMVLVADALHFHIPRNYIYFAIAFSAAVETLNLMADNARKTRKAKLAEREKSPGGLANMESPHD